MLVSPDILSVGKKSSSNLINGEFKPVTPLQCAEPSSSSASHQLYLPHSQPRARRGFPWLLLWLPFSQAFWAFPRMRPWTLGCTGQEWHFLLVCQQERRSSREQPLGCWPTAISIWWSWALSWLEKWKGLVVSLQLCGVFGWVLVQHWDSCGDHGMRKQLWMGPGTGQASGTGWGLTGLCNITWGRRAALAPGRT